MSQESTRIIRRHTAFAIGVGAIPIPVVDLAGLAIVQVKMLRQLAELHGISFAEQRAKSLTSTALATIIPNSMARTVGGSLAKAIPVVGPLLGAVTLSSYAGAATHALGTVFDKHFANGGDFLSFNFNEYATEMKNAFRSKQAATADVVAEEAVVVE